MLRFNHPNVGTGTSVGAEIPSLLWLNRPVPGESLEN